MNLLFDKNYISTIAVISEFHFTKAKNRAILQDESKKGDW